MAGLYVHVPFCKSRCVYCDFFSTTLAAEREAYVAALCREIRARRSELPHARVHTIYIGGGTPSQLTASQLAQVLRCIRENYDLRPLEELTVEVNPEDLVGEGMENSKLKIENSKLRIENWLREEAWLGETVRVSMGVQTFDDGLLRLLRRRHSSARAVEAVQCLRQAGIANISIDLIYGLPGQTLEMWERDLDRAFALDIQHLSAYALSYEEGTPLWNMRQRGEVREAPDELSVEMYERLCQRARAEGFEHYEISNFALPSFRSRHNSSYWTCAPYLGFGPGAHSFDGQRTRRANVPDLGRYLRLLGDEASAPAAAVSSGQDGLFIAEHLSDRELYNEAVMCGLRTRDGIDLPSIRRRFGAERLSYLMSMASPHCAEQRLTLRSNRLCLTEKALMVSDDIMSDLML